MSNFLVDEAMGFNRVEGQDNRKKLLDTGNNDDAYDDDYFSNRASSEYDDDKISNQALSNRSSLAQELPAASSHPNIIEEESIRSSGAAGRNSIAPVLPGLIQPAAPQGPRTNYTAEQGQFEQSEWLPKRGGNAFTRYFSSFGERRKQAGFWGALFGKGMKRADAAAAESNYNRAARARAIEQRQQQRANEPAPGALKSALKTKLANPEKITNLNTFPREPGVDYDPALAPKAHKAFMKNRRDFMNADEDTAVMDGLLPASVIAKLGKGPEAAQGMKTAYDAYDKSAGNRKYFAGGAARSRQEKLEALVYSNLHAGSDMFAQQGKQRQKPQRVRFKDGADDNVGLPVNDPNESYKNQPMPTDVRYFAAPIGKESLSEDIQRKVRQARYGKVAKGSSKAKQEAAANALQENLANEASNYLESGGASGHPDEISNAQAIEQAQYAFPIRSQMKRMGTEQLQNTHMRHEVNAMNLEQRLGDAAPDDDEFKDQYLRSQIGMQVENKRIESRNEDVAKSESRRFALEGLTENGRNLLGKSLKSYGYEVDTAKPLNEQMNALPRDYFDKFLNSGYDTAQHQAAGAAPVRAPGPAVVDGAPVGGGGGAGLIEEEEPLQS